MKSNDPENRNSLDTILASLGKDELINIIKEQVDMDERIEAKIIARHSVCDLTKNEYKKIISSTLNRFRQRGGFIPYRAASSACSGAESVLEKAGKYLESGNIAQALLAAQAVLEKIVPALQYADDSGGDLGSCIRESLEIFQNASTRKLDEKTRKDFFNYLVKEWDNERYEGWDWGMDLLEMAIDIHSGQSEGDKVFAAVESCFNNGTPTEKYKWLDNTVYSLKHKVLLKTGKTGEAEEFFNKNIHLPDFRRKAIEEAFKNKNYDRVIELADSGIKSDATLAGLINEWKKWKFKVCQARGEKDKIREMSLQFFLKGGRENYEFYKGTFPEIEWPAEYARLTGMLSGEPERSHVAFELLGYVYEKEKELAKLLALVQRQPSSIFSYESILLPVYPDEVIGMVAENLRLAAGKASARNEYWRLCNYGLKHLFEIKGDAKALELIDEFRQKYPRRPAMFDEISKFLRRMNKTGS